MEDFNMNKINNVNKNKITTLPPQALPPKKGDTKVSQIFMGQLTDLKTQLENNKVLKGQIGKVYPGVKALRREESNKEVIKLVDSIIELMEKKLKPEERVNLLAVPTNLK